MTQFREKAEQAGDFVSAGLLAYPVLQAADILVLGVPSYRHLGYRIGGNAVRVVVKRGAVQVGGPIQ